MTTLLGARTPGAAEKISQRVTQLRPLAAGCGLVERDVSLSNLIRPSNSRWCRLGRCVDNFLISLASSEISRKKATLCAV